MHLFLTDRLACPRCGPDFGLILLADEVRNQRVLDGSLGCPNCRERYPVREGFGDLRVPPRRPLSEASLEATAGAGGTEGADGAVRIGAMLGVTEGPGLLLLKGPEGRHGQALARILPGVEVVVLDPHQWRGVEQEGVSRLASGSRLPFRSNSFRGVLLSGETSEVEIREAARVAGPSARVVALGAPGGAVGWLEALGLEILMNDEGVVVARWDPHGPEPLVTLRGI